MPYFTRLTDIVTCDVATLFREKGAAAAEAIVAEIELGLQSARRSVETAEANLRRIDEQITQLRTDAEQFREEAKAAVASGDDQAGRLALLRKRQSDDILAGLEQERTGAVETRDYLRTTTRALEARLADARRQAADLVAGETPTATDIPTDAFTPYEEPPTIDAVIEDELAALKRELGQ
ncbi:MAG: hypothetical protein AAF532_16300 [Planctomycetota bacterium]